MGSAVQGRGGQHASPAGAQSVGDRHVCQQNPKKNPISPSNHRDESATSRIRIQNHHSPREAAPSEASPNPEAVESAGPEGLQEGQPARHSAAWPRRKPEAEAEPPCALSWCSPREGRSPQAHPAPASDLWCVCNVGAQASPPQKVSQQQTDYFALQLLGKPREQGHQTPLCPLKAEVTLPRENTLPALRSKETPFSPEGGTSQLRKPEKQILCTHGTSAQPRLRIPK